MSQENLESKSHKHKAFDCVCDTLLYIQEAQDKVKKIERNRDFVPIMLQTPYGNPFVTLGAMGEDDCFVTVFFKVKSVDCKQQCAQLELLRPNKSIVHNETEDVEWQTICDVDYVSETGECITLKLDCYSAVKCLSPTFGRTKD